MKKNFIALVVPMILLLMPFCSFSQTNVTTKNNSVNMLIKAITKDFTTWYNYNNQNIVLAQDFIGLDEDSIALDKKVFLNKLLKDDVVVIKKNATQVNPIYQLYSVKNLDKDIKATLQGLANNELFNLNLEGQSMPEFKFTDMVDNQVLLNGKTTLIKCWFIKCVACVKEFPELNELVEEHKTNNNLQFISLAMDDKEALLQFFKTKPFSYTTIPNATDYMMEKMNISVYPTHILVNSKGTIVKVVNKITDLTAALNRELSAK